MYLGFEKDVFKTIADYYGHLKEPLLTFHLFDAFVSVLGKLEYSEHISSLSIRKHFIFIYLEIFTDFFFDFIIDFFSILLFSLHVFVLFSFIFL